ncbi:tetratricopeptide repeat protein [Corynebacterium renale]|uniref:Putative thioredoxin n=1 Tax=Corynebacterium renale TaxID=1724 RepID=A0A2A9DSE8_9CORY|nr:tetratricopeptide repeat protein [Corynebacterium renale]PFG28902.1 putative thioredoxin [Corynebacterium renale]SQI25607.1 putative thioredoxin-like protein [Corynebacterium renale]
MAVGDQFIGGAIDLGQFQKKPQAGTGAAPANGSGVSACTTVTRDNFETAVARRSTQVPVIVVVGSAQAPESKTLCDDLTGLAEASDLAFVVAYVDADTTPEIAQVFGVTAVPTVIVLVQGQPVTSFSGAQPKDALQQWTHALVAQLGSQLPGIPASERGGEASPQDDPRLQSAEAALNAGKWDEAIAIYDQLIKENPHETYLKQARGNVGLLQRLAEYKAGIGADDADPVTAAEQNPSDLNAALAAADAEVISGAPERAFERLIGWATTATDADEKTAAKERLFELFTLFESDDSRVLDARRRLASALF